MPATATKNNNDVRLGRHLDWSARQGRILTDSGRAERHYCPRNGFPFSPGELPHHHLERGDSRAAFRRWARAAGGTGRSPIVGAWSRALFAGRWEHSTDEDEEVYNIQTCTLFVDLRIPRGRPASRWEELGREEAGPVSEGNGRRARRILGSMSDLDLRLFARQHVFGGYSLIEGGREAGGEMRRLPLCTRHHCLDWNYVPGRPRSRPNKWYIEGRGSGDADEARPPFDVWKEWSYASDERGRRYYWERWERIKGDGLGRGLRLAMRREGAGAEGDEDEDAILVAVGDHFNYVGGGRPRRGGVGVTARHPRASNLVELVDSAVAGGDRDAAISYLMMHGGHGRISSGWRVDAAIRLWDRGRTVFDCLAPRPGDGGGGARDDFRVAEGGGGGGGAFPFGWTAIVGDSSWEILECSVDAFELGRLLNRRVGELSPRIHFDSSRL